MNQSRDVRAAVITGRSRGGRAVLRVRNVPMPSPHAPGWVVVRPALSGVCDADLDLLGGNIAPAADAGQAVIPGHEVVGVVSLARNARWVREGQRVLVEPTLRCVHKGFPECNRCRADEGQLCENADRAGPVCGGRGIGSSSSTGGGWSEALLVHEDMLLPAEGISDQRAVLAEPAAAALHAVMRWQRRGDRALVIGTGPLGRLMVAILARIHRGLDITVVDPGPGQPRRWIRRRHRAVPKRFVANPEAEGAAIREMGAARVWRGGAATILDHAAALTNSRRLHHGATLPRLDRGVDVIFDCRGTSDSVDLSLRLLRNGGSLVLAQRPATLSVDWSLLWSQEISLYGAASYGREANGWRTFAVICDWLRDPAFPVDNMVTHRFGLDEVDAAVATAAAGSAAGAVKVVIEGAVTARRERSDPDDLDVRHDTGEPVFFHVAAKRVKATDIEHSTLPS